MKTLLLVSLLVSSSCVAAQSRHPQRVDMSGLVSNIATDRSKQTPTDIQEETENSNATQAKIFISRNPEDLNDTTGMEAFTIKSWTDSRGVRHYTDDPGKAPAGAKTRQVYNVPASTNQKSSTPAIATPVIDTVKVYGNQFNIDENEEGDE